MAYKEARKNETAAERGAREEKVRFAQEDMQKAGFRSGETFRAAISGFRGQEIRRAGPADSPGEPLHHDACGKVGQCVSGAGKM